MNTFFLTTDVRANSAYYLSIALFEQRRMHAAWHLCGKRQRPVRVCQHPFAVQTEFLLLFSGCNMYRQCANHAPHSEQINTNVFSFSHVLTQCFQRVFKSWHPHSFPQLFSMTKFLIMSCDTLCGQVIKKRKKQREREREK